MKKKFFKIMAFCLCTISLSISLCSCGFIDGVFDFADTIIGTDNSSNKQNGSSSSSGTVDSSESSTIVESVYVYEKIFDYGDYTVTCPYYVVCHVGDTFEVNITASNFSNLTYEVLIVAGCDDYFSINGHTVTALSTCSWQLVAKVVEIDIWYAIEVEVLV